MPYQGDIVNSLEGSDSWIDFRFDAKGAKGQQLDCEECLSLTKRPKPSSQGRRWGQSGRVDRRGWIEPWNHQLSEENLENLGVEGFWVLPDPGDFGHFSSLAASNLKCHANNYWSFMNSHVPTRKFVHQVALVHGVPEILTRCWSPMNPSKPSTEMMRKKKEETLEAIQKAAEQARIPETEGVVTFILFFSPKKKASRKWVDEDLLSFEQVFWKSLCNLNCSIFWFLQDAPLGEDLGVLGCKSLVFVEFGCATVFLWLQLMNVAT